MKPYFLLVLSVVVMGAMGLSGCVTTGGVTGLKPVCDVLGAPIKVNVTNKNSAWHAGPSLAKRVYQQDDKGANLGCAGY